MERIYRIAGLTIAMDTSGRTLEQAKPYLIKTDADVDFHVESSWDHYKQHRADVPDDLGEYLYSGFDFYKKLLRHGGLMLHSSAVVVDGKAYLFTADSGTGKSTHTGLWLKKFGDRAYILNDDKPAIRREEDGWFAYGTPWSGKYDISRNTRVPLAGIAAVNRAEENSIHPFGGLEAIQTIMKQANRPRGMEFRVSLMELLDRLLTEVPVWKLYCNMDLQAAEMSYDAMSGKGR
jgi:hypothetical protein